MTDEKKVPVSQIIRDSKRPMKDIDIDVDNMPSLADVAMIVKFNISKWTARKLDKAVTKKAIDDHAAVASAGRFNKLLVPDADIKPINQLATEAREYVYSVTGPTMTKGERTLSNRKFKEFLLQMQTYRDRFNVLVSDFCDRWNQIKKQAEIELGQMYNPSDYPDESAIMDRFDFQVSFEPVPAGDDFGRLIGLDDDIKKSLARKTENRAKAMMLTAMKDAWRRVYDNISHMAATLSHADARFKDTLVSNLCELADLLPALNVGEDPKLDELGQEIKERLCYYDPQTLRDNPEIRKEVAQAADDIMEKFGL